MTTTFENGTGDMASRTNPEHTQFNVNDTVLEFNRQYYTMLSTEPERLHFFYGKQSSLLHCLESETDVTVAQGLEDIHQRITAMEYNGVRVVIKNIDCQSSLQGSIFIFVMGVIFWPSGVERKFTESFVLAQQTNGYYIMNDIMRMTDAEAKPAAPISAVAPVRAPAVPVAVPQPEATKPAEPVAEPKAAEAPAPVEAKAAPKPAESKPAAKTPEPKPAPKTSSSWAELAADRNSSWKSGVIAESKAPVASIVAPKTALPSRPAASSGSRDAAPRRDAPQRTVRSADAPRREQRSSEKRSDRSERQQRSAFDPAKAIFVSGVLGAATAADVKVLFEKCGAITSFNVMASKGFAFIEFESEAAQKSALALGKPMCNGVRLNIEPRRGPRAGSDDPSA